jgi:hypothetical protein
MPDKTSNNFAIEWSEDIVDWVIEAADEDDVEPEVAVYASLAAAIVLARSVEMDDQAIRDHFEKILTKEFPEGIMGDGKK